VKPADRKFADLLTEADWMGIFSYLVRAHRGRLTVRQLGEKLNLSAATISRVERMNPPDLATFRALCLGLDIDPAFALGMRRRVRTRKGE
jgi:transcriptional regulator with XRE-family HTH domain